MSVGAPLTEAVVLVAGASRSFSIFSSIVSLVDWALGLVWIGRGGDGNGKEVQSDGGGGKGSWVEERQTDHSMRMGKLLERTNFWIFVYVGVGPTPSVPFLPRVQRSSAGESLMG
jgi:hypothetical protein